MTSSTSPAKNYTDIELAKTILGATPLLDLNVLFRVDIQILNKTTHNTSIKIERNTSFQEYLKVFNEGRSNLSRMILSRANQTELDVAWHVFDISAEYLICLVEGGFPCKQLVAHYERFVDYCQLVVKAEDDEAYETGLNLAVALLQPVIRWASNSTKSLEDATEIMKVLERAHAIICSNLRQQGGFSGPLLEFLNVVTYAYCVASELLGVGLSSPLYSSYLQVFRQTSHSAWMSVSEPIRLQFASLVLHFFKAFYDIDQPIKDKYGFSLNMLVDVRTVLADASQAANNGGLLSHQWVFGWVRDKIDADVLSVRKVSIELGSLSDSEHQSIVELAKRFGSYRFPITVDHLEAFLLQFGSTQRIRAAIRMLSHTKFYPMWQLAEAIESQLEKYASAESPVVIAPSGDRTGSTAIINYLASHSKLSSKVVFSDDIKDALHRTKGGEAIYFIDDCLLSGTQMINSIKDVLGVRIVKAHHTRYSEPLADELQTEFRNRKLRFIYCLACDFGVQRVKNELASIGLAPENIEIESATIEPLSSKAFEPMGPVGWASAEERDDLKNFVAEVGYDLLAERAKRKGWTDDRRHESSLGYSGFQRLLVFPYNVPKTTLPIYWERGGADRRWLPLFPGSD